jgi:DNA-directed RNA polymerase subunit K/omega
VGVIDGREQALQYAAGLKGLTLVRSGDKYALVHYALNDASLDEVEAFLASDTEAGLDAAQGGRRADLRAMLKAERALLVEMADKRETDEGGGERASTEAALAEIRRRIAELQTEMGHKDGP